MSRKRCLIVLTLAASMLLAGCEKEEEFPNQIPDVKAALGVFQQAISSRNALLLDSVSTDTELYGELINVLGDDSMAVLSRRIENPIDSARVIMTIAPKSPDDSLPGPNYDLELFLRKRGDAYWIIAHRLKPSPR